MPAAEVRAAAAGFPEPTLAGLPAVLAFACYASMTTHSRRPVSVAGILVVLIASACRPQPRPTSTGARRAPLPFPDPWANSAAS
jgi:hypothetical protein